MNAAGASREPARTHRVRAGFAALLMAFLIVSLTGCGIRLETPPLTEPEPDAFEIARRAVVGDVLAIQEVATATLDSLEGQDPSKPLLEEMIVFGTVHLDQLGGVYVSGLDPDPESTHLPEPTPSAADSEAGVEIVVDRLEQAYARGRGVLEIAPEPGLARLIASIATNHLASAHALAKAADLELPAQAEAGPPRMPSEPLKGVSTSWLNPIIVAEDSAGHGYEVLAARLEKKPRKRALARADLHRGRAEAAAQSAQVARSSQDPRRAAYALPEGALADPPKNTALRMSELTLTGAYADLIAQVDAADRVTFFDLMVDSYSTAISSGAEQETFPGLAEQAGSLEQN